MWCLVTKDIDTMEVCTYAGTKLEDGLDSLRNSSLLIGHNIINFDLPLVEKLYNIRIDVELFDTLVVSRLLNPDRIGGHSLDSWGKRVGRSKPVHEDWTQYSEAMLHRCVEDVEINYLTYNLLLEEVKDGS